MGKEKGELFLVDEILDIKIVRGKPYYLVKWTGYGHDQNTWEPLKNVKDCLKHIENFEAKFGKKHARALMGRRRLSSSSSSSSTSLSETSASKRSNSKLTPKQKRLKSSRDVELVTESSGDDDDDDSNNTSSDDDGCFYSLKKKTTESEPRKVDESKCATIPAVESRPMPSLAALSASPPCPKSKKQPSIDFDEIERMQYDKNLVPDYIMGVIPNKETGKLYFVFKWKNPLKDAVQIVYSKFANKYYPQTVIEFYESKLKFEN